MSTSQPSITPGGQPAITIPAGTVVPATRVIRADEIVVGDVIVHRPDRFDRSTRLVPVVGLSRSIDGYVQLHMPEGGWSSAMGDLPLTVVADLDDLLAHGPCAGCLAESGEACFPGCLSYVS